MSRDWGLCGKWASKPTPTRRGGGHAVLRTSVLEQFCLKSLLAPRRGAKIEGPGFQGPLLGLGGEAKASPTTSFACCLKLRFAKLEAPLRGAGGGLTTARLPVPPDFQFLVADQANSYRIIRLGTQFVIAAFVVSPE